MTPSRLLAEWRHNRRLRVGVMVVAAILGSHFVLDLRDQTTAALEQAREEASTRQRLGEATAERAWPVRARAAATQRDVLLKSIPKADTEGAAQAHLQAWLVAIASETIIVDATTRIDSTVDVEGFPDLSQIVARLEGTVPTATALEPVVRALAEGQPWIQVDELQIAEGEPVRVRAIVRGLYRLPYDVDALAAGDGP